MIWGFLIGFVVGFVVGVPFFSIVVAMTREHRYGNEVPPTDGKWWQGTPGA